MYLKAALLIVLVSLGSVANARTTLRDMPGPSHQLKAFLPAAPEGWVLHKSTLGTNSATPVFPWATTLYLNDAKMVNLTIAGGVRNGTYRQINEVINNKELAEINGIQIVPIKGRNVLVWHEDNGNTEFAVNVGRNISVVVRSYDEKGAKAILMLVNFDELEKLAP